MISPKFSNCIDLCKTFNVTNWINITFIEQVCCHLLRISKYVYIHIHKDKYLINKLTCLLNKISIHRAIYDTIACEKM